jgi:hypothetical protein
LVLRLFWESCSQQMTHTHLFYIEFENLEDSDIVFFFRFYNPRYAGLYFLKTLCSSSSQKHRKKVKIQIRPSPTARTMDTPRRMLIDYTQRGKKSISSQGKQRIGSLCALTQTTLSDLSRTSQVFPRHSPAICSETESNAHSMTISFNSSSDSDSWMEDDPAQILSYEAIRCFRTIQEREEAGYHDCCLSSVESSEDRPKRYQHRNEIARMLSPRPRRNALSLNTDMRR